MTLRNATSDHHPSPSATSLHCAKQQSTTLQFQRATSFHIRVLHPHYALPASLSHRYESRINFARFDLCHNASTESTYFPDTLIATNINMSGKLDQSLDEILSTKPTGGRRSTRKTARPAAPAPVGGVKKNTKPVRGAAAKPSSGKAPRPTGESKIIVSNLVRTSSFAAPRSLLLMPFHSPRTCPRAKSRYVTDEAITAFGDFCRHSIHRVLYRHDHAAHRTRGGYTFYPYLQLAGRACTLSLLPSSPASSFHAAGSVQRSRAPRFAQRNSMLGVPGKHPTQA